MPERAKPFLVSRENDPQLQRLNEKIAALTAIKPCSDVYGSLSSAARLAGDANLGGSACYLPATAEPKGEVLETADGIGRVWPGEPGNLAGRRHPSLCASEG